MSNNSKAALSYVFGLVSAVIFLVVERENEFVRKSAAQSFVFSILWCVMGWVPAIIPIVGRILSAVVGLVGFVLWIVLIVKAAQNIYFKLPVVSELSETYVLQWFR